MTSPLVSIILATWNRAPLLRRAIASVRAQRWKHWELIIVDDGSTDGTQDLLAEVCRSDTRIKIFRHANAGPARSRNEGMRHARGDIVTFLDSDDEYLPEHLYSRMHLFQHDRDLPFVHGGILVSCDPSLAFVPDLDDTSRLIPLRDCAVGGTFFARRGVIESVGGWHEGYGEDADLLRRISLRYRLLRVDTPTYLYHRETADSRCTQAGEGA
ncbi:MAG: glycosyltransferase [Bacteroidia bacterium]|nr:glycosyltransferase [Bacteroidia bacterium]